MRTGIAPKSRYYVAVRLGIFLAIAVFLAVPLYTASTASLHQGSGNGTAAAPSRDGKSNRVSTRFWSSVAPAPVFVPGIATFAADCTTPKSQFVLGDVVCAVVTEGITFPRRVAWVDPSGFIREVDPITSDPQSFTFTIPSTQTSTVGNSTVDNRGTWKVNMISSRASLVASAQFLVTDPANQAADLSVSKSATADNQIVAAGANANFQISIQNSGPDAAVNVVLTDVIPASTSLIAITQTSGPTFACGNTGGTVTCTIAGLNRGDSASFNFNYMVSTGTSNGTTISNTATGSSDTADGTPENNASTATAVVGTTGGGGGGCDLECPSDITVTANTVEGGQPGAHVSYPDATSTGTCGTITATPPSGSFFPIGTTVVTSTSGTGGGECTFQVTVEEAGNTNITCPASITANADANCGATVTLGTPTATGTNVTTSVSRSDGLAMYDCDTNGENCVRKSTDLPFAAGVTVVTWTAYSHDIPGPYANNDDEEAHRTGNAACQQTVTINDVTPPTITASNTSASADANCQAPVPNYATLATVSDNCACASSDNSQICDSREDITITQSPAPGTLVGLGPHTITLTANDGSSNNGGAGNTASVNVTFTVNDTTAPTINCPGNILGVHTDPGICAATVNPGAATASDNCSTPTIVGVRSDAQALNALYPKGTTTITWTATDAAGNHSSCVQTITVIDVEPPTISCQADIVADFDPAVNGATVNYTTPVGTDNCAGSTTARTAGLASGSTFPTGTTTNTFTVTDASGNTASCSFKVTVALTSIIGLDSVNISGSGYADSYSSAGGYPATKGSLANVLSNGTITMGNSGKVWGNVRSTRANVNMSGSSQVTGNATAGTTVTTSGSASVGGTRTNNALAPVMTLPPVAACSPYSSNSGITGTYTYNAGTGDLTLSGVNIATLANGNYCFHNITLGNSSQLKVNGLVVIKMTGVLNTSGATSLNNTTQIPSNLRILSSYSGSNGVILGNSTSIYALIYSPTTGLNLSGSAPLFGTFAGKTLIIGSSGALHYDTQLKSVWPAVWALLP